MVHLQPLISDFSSTRPFELIVGVDLKGTTVEGLRMLVDALGQHGTAYVFHNSGPSTFHPKLFSFTYPDRTEVYVGSGNLTAGGLFTNHEAGVLLSLGDAEADTQLLQQTTEALDRWSVNAGDAAHQLDSALIDALIGRGLIAPEAEVRAAIAASQAGTPTQTSTNPPSPPIFGSFTVAAAPAALVAMSATGGASSAVAAGPAGSSAAPGAAAAAASVVAAGATPAPPAAAAGIRHFVMTLQNTDVGTGQTSANTSRRSPEVFIPLAARDYDPAFWDWPHAFIADPNRPGKLDRPGVPFLVNGQPTDVHIWYNPVKKDVRLRNEVLRSAGQVGDILQLERHVGGGALYVATTIPPTDARYAGLLARCTQSVRNSLKRFGYF